MPSDWKGAFSRRLQRQASERGRHMAKARWAREHERRRKLAELNAEQYSNSIARRIIVIERERFVREVTIFDFDTAQSARNKIRSVLGAQIG